MIISLFGPDGVGKSTAAKLLRDKGIFVFSGTGVASWPDQTWIRELERRGIDEPSHDDESHFTEKIVRAHELARRLEGEYGVVVIDSDPLHKTLMHDALKGRDRFDDLWKLAYPSGEVSDVKHVYLYLDGVSNDEAAMELQRRITKRGELAPFDPGSIEQSFAMIRACERLHEQISSRGKDIIKLATNQSLDDKINQMLTDD